MHAPVPQPTFYERYVKKYWLYAVLLMALATGAFFFFRHWSERKVTEGFIAALQAGDYPKAYTYWGCSVEKPCRNYAYQTFLRDWGAAGLYKDAKSLKVATTIHCDSGVISELPYPGEDQPLYLMVESASMAISYSPWGQLCNPRLPVGYVKGAAR